MSAASGQAGGTLETLSATTLPLWQGALWTLIQERTWARAQTCWPSLWARALASVASLPGKYAPPDGSLPSRGAVV